ncbi:MAG TPA: hypothetical protein VKP65_25605 [Rhodothermales bacterium]|nr:hypothetical protein [Rhodothermales bacterium]
MLPLHRLPTAFATLICLFLFALPTMAQETDSSATERPMAAPEDVVSVDAIITALYDVISGPAGEARDWDRFRSLMMPSAQLIPIVKRQDGTIGTIVWSAEEYIKQAGGYLEANGFFETEAARQEERYGNLVHAFSTYDSFRTAEDEEPFQRGINSIQLIYQNNRWWVANIAWQSEWPGLPIPTKYQPAGSE